MGPRWRRNPRVAPSPLRGGLGRGISTKTCRTVLKRCGNDIEHALGMVQNIIVGKAQNLEASGREILVARPVVGLRDFTAMGIPIDLDDQLGVDTGEIDVVRPDLNLFAKVKAARAQRPQQLP